MAGSQITDYKAPQWFRMQTHPAPAGLFCTFPGEGALLHRRGFGIAPLADVQLTILKVAYLLSLRVFTQAAHCFYKAPYTEDKC